MISWSSRPARTSCFKTWRRKNFSAAVIVEQRKPVSIFTQFSHGVPSLPPTFSHPTPTSTRLHRIQKLQSSSKEQTNASTVEIKESKGNNDADQELACFGEGAMVECVIPPSPSSSLSSSSSSSELKPLNNTSSSRSSSKDSRVASSKEKTKPDSALAIIIDTLLLVSPFFFWGTSMVAMKELAPHSTPLFLAAWRLIPAGIVLLIWAAYTGRKQPNSAMAWLAISLFGLADGTMFQGFLAEGLQRTSAGLGSVIIDSQPLTVALLASIFFEERLGPLGIAGLGLGVFGLLLLEVPSSALFDNHHVIFLQDLVSHASSNIATTATATATTTTSIDSLWSIWNSGEWWMLLAAQSMAIGTVMVRWVAKYCDPVIATGWHMILGGIPLALLAIMQQGDDGSTSALLPKLAQVTPSDVGLLMYVSLLGSAASYGVFFYQATVRGNLTALSSLTFLTPMFAAAGGYLLLGETLTPLQLVGATVTLGAVTLLTYKKS